MTTTRIFRALLLLAIFCLVLAYAPFFEAGDDAQAWLLRMALIAGGGALVIGLAGAETRPRLMLRFLAALFALLGVISCAADFALAERSSGADRAYSLLDHLNSFAPSLVMSSEAWIGRVIGAWAWDPVLSGILDLPATLIFFLLAIAAGIAGRPRRTVHIFVN